MENAMTTLAGSIALASGKGNDGNSHKTAAVAAIEENEGLSEDEFTEAVEMFMANSEAARMYLAIKKPDARTRFLHSQLNKARNFT